MAPTISIGLPVYNAESRIRTSIETILSQDFEDFELVIVDNKSNDGTAVICEEYARADARVRFFRNDRNIGAAPNHNRVFELSRGRYFKWTADDVVCLPGMLRRCHEAMASAPRRPALVYPRCEIVAPTTMGVSPENPSVATGSARPHHRVSTVLRNLVWVTQLYGLMPSDVLRRTRLVGSFPSSDYVLMMELAMHGEIVELPETLLRRWLEPGRGAYALRDDGAGWTAWLDPARAGRPVALSRDQRLHVEYLRSVRRSSLGLPDRLRCSLSILGAYARRSLLRPAGHRARRWTRRLLRVAPGRR